MRRILYGKDPKEKMKDLSSLTLQELKEYIAECGQPSYRALQVYQWLHKTPVASFDEMTNLPLKLRKELEEEYSLPQVSIEKVRKSKADGTRKYLLKMEDGVLVESVLMKYRHGYSQCISSQAGCLMGCVFCASGADGLVRDLTAGEMLREIYSVEALEGIRVSNVVVMGMGEPLDNYDNLISFLEILISSEGRDLGGRQITVSTCGLVPQIRKLAERKLPITLALSLHAPDDDIRRKLMPIAKKYSIEETVDAMRYYGEVTGRRVTFEYSLIKGVNDSGECAENLGRLLYGIPCLINLIPVNEVPEKGYYPPSRREVASFQKKLENLNNNVTIRRGMGSDIEGACGQLRRRYYEPGS